MAEPILEYSDVTRTFRAGGNFGRGRRLQAVRGVSLAIAPGASVAIVGESGCGKSTLARMAVGLERPDSGTVRIAGESLQSGSRTERRAHTSRIQLIPQDAAAALDPRVTIGESVAEPLVIHRRGTADERRKRVLDLLTEVGLEPDIAGRFPHQISGGQRQRVVTARALALEPNVLVADEPVSALDVSVRAQVLSLLRDIQRRRSLALVIISHDLAVVRGITSQVAVMYLGRIVEFGATDDVIQRPTHPYSAALVAAFPGPDPTARSALVAPKGDVPSAVDLPLGCAFAGRCPVVRDDCRTTDPLLTATNDGDRKVACLHPLAAATPID